MGNAGFSCRAAETRKLSLELGERSDISRITTETIDRDKAIVLGASRRYAHLLHNRQGTLNRYYDLPPVGQCIGLMPVTALQSPDPAVPCPFGQNAIVAAGQQPAFVKKPDIMFVSPTFRGGKFGLGSNPL